MAEQLADQQADARSIARAMGDVGQGEYPVDKAQELLELIASRPAVSDVELIDENGRVVAASEHGDIGEVEDGLSAEVARNGRAHMGEDHESVDPTATWSTSCRSRPITGASRSRPTSRARSWTPASPACGGRR